MGQVKLFDWKELNLLRADSIMREKHATHERHDSPCGLAPRGIFVRTHPRAS